MLLDEKKIKEEIKILSKETREGINSIVRNHLTLIFNSDGQEQYDNAQDLLASLQKMGLIK